ncbi:heavy metal-associated isoprenylated plant protein 5-like [Neltuma alba]|uniref:heavy metal-associated isoprenylated plant protein 5-like n=1 Tax=Neltuma alba TaxID=207710 RepID=UPI0010A50ADB|nr:heavy metal-associated isoprenylated plant protein 5-like [Prosopis alba]
MQRPQITEIQLRMDCNGCVQKIKKALSGINGIYDLYIDFPQQKITVIGWADQEKIAKAIKKTRKTATICSPAEPEESPYQPPEPGPAPDGYAPAPDSAQQPPPAEVTPDEIPPQEEPPEDTSPPEATIPTDNKVSQKSENIPGAKDVGKVHAIHQYPPYYGNRFDSGHNYVGCWNRYHNSTIYSQEPSSSMYLPHSHCNAYKPSASVTEYEYIRSPPRHPYYSRMEYYSGDYQSGNANITSIFSDENPNACRMI